MNLETYRFKLGAFQCVVVNDGDIDDIAVKDFFVGATPEALQTACDQYQIHTENLPIPCNIMLIDTGEHKILVDTGASKRSPTLGKLTDGLRAEGIAPEDITHIFLSHGHYDHAGGNHDGRGNITFPKAEYFMLRGEYVYWTEQANAPREAENLTIIQDRLHLIDAAPHSFLPGFEILPTPGHTVYHASLMVTSGEAKMCCVVDTMDHPIHLANPDWHPYWEMQPEQSIPTRKGLLHRAVDENLLIHAFHFPFPGVGRVHPDGEVWRWEAN